MNPKRFLKSLFSLIVIFTATIQPLAFSSDKKIECKASAWPYSRKQSDEHFHRLFEDLKRDSLIQYFFHEITSTETKSIAALLARYLIGTEQDKDMRSFFELLQYSAELEKQKYAPLKLNEVCDIYKKVRLQKK